MAQPQAGVSFTFRCVLWLASCFGATSAVTGAGAPDRQVVMDAMKRATSAMVEKVAVRGGYVWACLPDFSRRWGELEATASMIWIQPPGTPSMGQVFLDAYHATGDEYYYRAAEGVAEALIAGQHPAGGWNYVVDFAGEESLKRWYATVGRNAWRLEEFQHYYGNATFDDGGTAEATKFLLRLYVEKRDERYRAPLDRAIGFVLASQHACGAWPQRFPKTDEFSHGGRPDYTGFLTFNNDVAAENIDVLLLCYQALGDERLCEPIARAMNSYLITQQAAPQPGWALQYTPDLKPAGARTYEPLALATHTTVDAVEQLIKFYRLTGDGRFLARVPEALDWLDSLRLPEEQRINGATHPTFVEIGSGRTLYLHRSGSNVVNGRYYADYERGKPLGHYSSTRQLDTDALRKASAEVRGVSREEITKGSVLADPAARGVATLPRYFSRVPKAFAEADAGGLNAQVTRVMEALDADGFWLTPLRMNSHPYSRDGAQEKAEGDFSGTQVGDITDTSPFSARGERVMCISTAAYIRNMNVLIAALQAEKRQGGFTSGGAK
jgi:PelA/Pel-15E family pectate lyase